MSMADETDRAGKTDEEYTFIKEKIKKKPLNKKKLFMKIGSTVLLAVLFGVVASITFFAVGTKLRENKKEEDEGPFTLSVDEPSDPDEEEQPNENQSEEAQELELSDYEKLYDELYTVSQEVRKSLVTVTGVRNGEDWFNATYEDPNPEEAAGVIIDNAGDILVLTHQRVTEGVSRIKVTFGNGYEAEAALRKSDTNTGIAIISISAADASYNNVGDITAATWGSSRIVKQGDPVIALGSPQGYKDSLAYGFVTSKTNSVSVYDAQYKIITTDIYGNSNGTGILVNLNGEVIGIIAQHFNSDGSDNITCIGTSEVTAEIENMSRDQAIPYIGIKAATVTDSIAKEQRIEKGVYVLALAGEESPAWHAGLQRGDIIVEFNGEAVRTVEEYRNQLLQYNVGDVVTLMVMRGDEENSYESIEIIVDIGVL